MFLPSFRGATFDLSDDLAPFFGRRRTIYSPTKTEYFPPPPVAELDQAQLSFANKQPPKKKRKSRTAFTNHQIFELEKRFLYQKYLSPADRDEIAAALGLTNAQVSQTMRRSYQARNIISGVS